MTDTSTFTRKTVQSVRHAPGRHWVGDGFPVHGLFGYSGEGVAERSPFLMLDYAAPTSFSPTTQRRGVGSHPHRGFETVTIVYDGEVEHRDSTGAGGVIGKGDVQWMTAGGGIVHEEFHSAGYAARGGPFEMVQLWVNLPAKDKMTPAHYQAITDAQIPAVDLPGGAGRVRVIAGAYGNAKGPARTFTPMNVLDLRLGAGHTAELPQPEGWSTLVVVLAGTVQINGEAVLRATDTATLSNAGTAVGIEANGDAKLLLLAGQPIDEPVVGYGPFVMNSAQQINQAIDDFNSGRFTQAR
ncbi:MAG: pirin family protein [Burkholderiaceae bacterium]|nr:pirin family protein [Pseudomonadota bacterium]MBS0598254.1 pirin family protein [Pseudomonadota bacterium]MCO5117616.1 pirin family protein [Burkholderiaceae bacterium]MCP5216509.1 pirin family protein [Burkholderiaceae bacterium]